VRYSFAVCDVFTQSSFGGNPLAVVLDAEGLTTQQMQNIAREFNYSETTFVLPPQRGGDFHVRIFTPSSEVPFAGHPNIGTSFVLAKKGLVRTPTVVFEEKAGDVPVSIDLDGRGNVYTELTAPEPLSLSAEFPVELLAEILTLSVSDIEVSRHQPLQASVGLPFIMVELTNLEALQQAKVNSLALEQLLTVSDSPFIHIYYRSNDDFDLRARMFAPTDGVPEDPATGSANCALAALLATLDLRDSFVQTHVIAQGVEMGRPSQLKTTVVKNDGEINEVKIGGYSVLFSEGEFEI
jgi:trans-2,3-dihydro-3-hydroxyanthranilate isomerase